MNAYELADKLEWHWDNDCRSPAISKSADMLRQQADRIAKLESYLEAYKTRVAELEVYEKQMQKIKNRKDLLNFILEKE